MISWSHEPHAVLHEIKGVKQERGAGRRRWFESDGLELVVWLDAREAITGFQLCYDFGKGPHALTWRADSGFAHNAVDEGDETPLKNQTPILIPDGIVPWRDVARIFEARSATLEPSLRHLVHEKLADQAGASAR